MFTRAVPGRLLTGVGELGPCPRRSGGGIGALAHAGEAGNKRGRGIPELAEGGNESDV